MNKHLKREWVSALRSGIYPQSQGRLEARHGFCCLGVCQMVESGGVEKLEDGSSRSNVSPEWAVKHDLDGSIVSYLVEMNDGHGKSFKEIADWIEDNITET